jgi:Tfp pilus assembly protein PilO
MPHCVGICKWFISKFAFLSIQEQGLKLSELESENRKMKVELEEFRTEATHLKNQQATIRRLEERNRQLEQQVCNFYSNYNFQSFLITFSFIP